MEVARDIHFTIRLLDPIEKAWRHLVSEWIDIPKIKRLCHHTSTFGVGVVIWALAKPAVVIAQWIGVKCKEPISDWLVHGFALLDDVLLGYFVLGLGIRIVIELWPFQQKNQPEQLLANHAD